MSLFPKGRCVKCGSSVGFKFSKGYDDARKCTNTGCGKMFCYDCCPRVGLLGYMTLCPICGNPTERV